MESKADSVVFRRLRDVWNARYRFVFRRMALALGHSNPYMMSLCGVMGFSGGKPVFVMLVDDGSPRGAGCPVLIRGGRRVVRFVFFEKAHGAGKRHDKGIVSAMKGFLESKGAYGVYIYDTEKESAAGLSDAGFRNVLVLPYPISRKPS